MLATAAVGNADLEEKRLQRTISNKNERGPIAIGETKAIAAATSAAQKEQCPSSPSSVRSQASKKQPLILNFNSPSPAISRIEQIVSPNRPRPQPNTNTSTTATATATATTATAIAAAAAAAANSPKPQPNTSTTTTATTATATAIAAAAAAAANSTTPASSSQRPVVVRRVPKNQDPELLATPPRSPSSRTPITGVFSVPSLRPVNSPRLSGEFSRMPYYSRYFSKENRNSIKASDPKVALAALANIPLHLDRRSSGTIRFDSPRNADGKKRNSISLSELQELCDLADAIEEQKEKDLEASKGWACASPRRNSARSSAELKIPLIDMDALPLIGRISPPASPPAASPSSALPTTISVSSSKDGDELTSTHTVAAPPEKKDEEEERGKEVVITLPLKKEGTSDCPVSSIIDYVNSLPTSSSATTTGPQTKYIIDLQNEGIGANKFTNLTEFFLQEGAKESSKAKELKIEIMRLEGNGLGSEGMENFEKFLSSPLAAHLQAIYLNFNSLCSKGIEFLSKGLETSDNNVLEIDLEGNAMESLGALHLSSFLRSKTCRLVSLHMPDNQIGDEGLSSLCTALSQNQTVTFLDLSNNDIGESGMRSLSQALEENKTLQTLILNSNMLYDEGALLLAQVLECNSTLTHLEVNSCCMSTEGVMDICSSLRNNKSVKVLKLKMNDCGLLGEMCLQDVLLSERSVLSPGVYLQLVWKDCHSPWSDDEYLDIVSHYGFDTFLEMIMEGRNFYPLLEDTDEILEYLPISSNLDNFASFFEHVIEKPGTRLVNGMEVILTALESPDNQSILVSLISTNLPSIISCLSEAIKCVHIGSALSLIQLLRFVLENNSDLGVCLAPHVNTISELFIKMFFECELRSVIEYEVERSIKAALKIDDFAPMLEALHLHDRLMEWISLHSSKHVSGRPGNFGFALSLANFISTTPSLTPMLNSGSGKWKEFQEGILEKELSNQRGHLGGEAPKKTARLNPFKTRSDLV